MPFRPLTPDAKARVLARASLRGAAPAPSRVSLPPRGAPSSAAISRAYSSEQMEMYEDVAADLSLLGALSSDERNVVNAIASYKALRRDERAFSVLSAIEFAAEARAAFGR